MERLSSQLKLLFIVCNNCVLFASLLFFAKLTYGSNYTEVRFCQNFQTLTGPPDCVTDGTLVVYWYRNKSEKPVASYNFMGSVISVLPIYENDYSIADDLSLVIERPLDGTYYYYSLCYHPHGYRLGRNVTLKEYEPPEITSIGVVLDGHALVECENISCYIDVVRNTEIALNCSLSRPNGNISWEISDGNDEGILNIHNGQLSSEVTFFVPGDGNFTLTCSVRGAALCGAAIKKSVTFLVKNSKITSSQSIPCKGYRSQSFFIVYCAVGLLVVNRILS